MSESHWKNDPPTFSRDISPLFTQYDAIQMAYSFDLRSYEDVKKYAEAIYLVVQPDPENPGHSKFKGIPVMPLYEAPWTQEMIDTFKAWMDAGYPPGELPPPPPPLTPELPYFISLSEILTGLEGLDKTQELAQIYLDRLQKESQYLAEIPALLQTWDQIAQLPPEQQVAAVQDQIMGDEQLAPLAQQIILLWYNATLNGVFGTPENNQYTDALVWSVAQCHPMGWATENVPFYWRYQPEGTQYTGLQKPALLTSPSETDD